MTGRYSYYVADLGTGVVRDELPLRGVSFSTALNDAGEFRGQLVLGDPRIAVHEPSTAVAPGRTALYVERDGVPVWGGVVWTSRYSSADRTIEIDAAGFLSYFDHRRVLPSTYDSAADDLATLATSYTDVDQTEIVRDLVRQAQAQPGGDIGIEPAETEPAAAPILRTISYPGAQLKSVGEALRELAALEDGPDVLFDVAHAPGGGMVRRLLVGTPMLGQQGSPYVWEYGANLVSYTWSEDGSSTANRIFALGGTRDGDQGQLIAVAADQTTGSPLAETEVSYLDIMEPDVLRSHATAALAAVSRPVVLPELTVRADLDPVLGSYHVGDDALIVINDAFFAAGVQFSARIIGIAVTPGDDAAEEEVQLTVSPLQNGPA
ncbi:MAG TPA: hypothetical protein VF069_05340 [Streptosporangiaceae bacterium]